MKLTDLELARLGDRNWNRSDFVKEIRARLKAAGFKYCPGCAEVFPIENFTPGQTYCRSCVNARGRRYYAKNREAVAERTSLYRRVTKEAIAAIDTDAEEPEPDLLTDDFDFDDDEYN